MIGEEDRRWVEETVERYKKQYRKTAETSIRVDDDRDVLTISSKSVEHLALNIKNLLPGHRRDTEGMIERWVKSLGNGDWV